MQGVINDFCWTGIQAKDVKPGNLITGTLAKTPRLISNVIVQDNVVTLFEKTGSNEYLYIKVTAEHNFDMLVNQSTGVPVTAGEVYA